MIGRVLEAAETFRAEAVAGHANDEKIVGTLVEDELDRYTRVGAAQDRREGPLRRCAGSLARDPEIARVHRNHALHDPVALGCRIEQRGDRPAALVEPSPSLVRVRRTLPA